MKKLLLAACAVLALTGMARGDDFKPYAQVGAWGVGSGGNFCMASAYFPHNETTLAFGIGVNGSAGITITNRKWNIPEGKYEIKLALDSGDLSSVMGNGDEKTVSWLFELGENSINALSKGKVFRVVVGNSEYDYGLAGSSAMLSALVQCATRIASDSNPFAPKPAAPVSTPSNPFKRT